MINGIINIKHKTIKTVRIGNYYMQITKEGRKYITRIGSHSGLTHEMINNHKESKSLDSAIKAGKNWIESIKKK